MRNMRRCPDGYGLLSPRHIYQVFSCGLHISCIERNWLPFSKCCITFDKSYDNFWRGNVFFRNLKDSCDGSGLNTSKSSKGSCPYFRYCLVVMLSNFHSGVKRHQAIKIRNFSDCHIQQLHISFFYSTHFLSSRPSLVDHRARGWNHYWD